MHDLPQKLYRFLRDTELLHPGDRVGVAVSGGSDSVALLRLLLELRKELGVVLSVVHLNHQLRGSESDADADFVCALAREHKLQLHSTVADVKQHASQAGISIETAARELRYKFFRELLGEVRPVLDKLATGHTLDDQAETVLMRLIRGTGMRGLRAIQPRISVESAHGTAEIVRPLLQVRRSQLERYLNDIGQSWREDTTNRDPKFTRNRVRQVLVPLLESEFNPAIKETLAELAEIARAEEEFWENEADGWLGTGIHLVLPQAASQLVQLAPLDQRAQSSTPGKPAGVLIDLAWLLSEETAVQRRIVKAAADQVDLALGFQHVEDILYLAAKEGSTGKELVLPGGWKVLCGEDALEFVVPQRTPDPDLAPDYELRLPIPGEVSIVQIGSRLQALRLEPGTLPADANPDHLFDPSQLAESLTVRNWRPGDRFWPAHTKSAKKIKELLQDLHIAQPERARWPLVLSGNEVIWLRGFPGQAHMRPPAGRPAVLIRELT